MKRINEFVFSNIRQIVEIFLLVIVSVLPFFINLPELFKEYIKNNSLSPQNIIWHTAITHGKCISSVTLFIFLLWRIRKYNDGFVMNRKNVYHNYCYAWYWCCSNVLGIRKCNLILVPIYMQFKLVIRGTFEEFPLNDNEYPIMENEPECKVTIVNDDASEVEINQILEDTYAIEDRQIPKSRRQLKTIKISRNGGNSNARHFSQSFIEAIMNTVRGIDRISVINIYATTNPMNTMHIAKRVFALADRGNVDHLYVFQQARRGRRYFEPKGYKVY